MKALQISRPRTFDLVNAPVPRLDPNETDQIVVRTAFVSICGSDIPFFNGTNARVAYPLPPGAHVHECVGEVVESSSPGFQPGDFVTAIPDHDAGLAEHFLARGTRAALLPQALHGQGEACIIQPLATVLNAVDQLGDVQGKSIAVLGLGSIGLMFCWLLGLRRAGEVVGIDPLPQRCAVAERMGATRTFHRRAAEVARSRRQSGLEGLEPEICIEAVGHQTETVNDCIELIRHQGEILAFGVPDQAVYDLEFEAFFRKNARMLAVVTPPWADYLAKARDLFLAHRDELSALVTHRLPIHQAQQAFSFYERHEAGIVKVILHAPFDSQDFGA